MKRCICCYGLVGLALFLTLVSSASSQNRAAAPAKAAPSTQVFTVDGRIALAAFESLCNSHLRKLADSLQLIAASTAARSEDWDEIRIPLADVAKVNAPAVLWFAQPDGSYWTLEQGRVEENLASRPYFPRALKGQTVIGDLVVSRSSGKSVAVIAVPIVRPDKTVAGVLGASVHLDRLSALIRQEMNLDDSVVFFTFNSSPLLGLVWDPGLILVDPMNLGDAVSTAFHEMMNHEHGTVSYTFRGAKRTVLYRKSALTGWWYGFGVIHKADVGSTAGLGVNRIPHNGAGGRQ